VSLLSHLETIIVFRDLFHFSRTYLCRQRTDISKQLEKRVAPQIARVVIKTWFKIGKAILKDYEAIAEGFDAEGAGFHRDFTDLVEAELPEPPAGFDPNVVPT
jgi:hypothetical protein